MQVHFTVASQFYVYINMELYVVDVEQYLALPRFSARYRRVTVLPYYPHTCLLLASVFVEFSVYLVDGPRMCSASGSAYPQASQTCCDSYHKKCSKICYITVLKLFVRGPFVSENSRYRKKFMHKGVP